MIRDQALAVSGLLYKKIGGPSVKPQPDGLLSLLPIWCSARFVSDAGEKFIAVVCILLETDITSPQMAIMDAPSREGYVLFVENELTPLQALAC